MTYIYYIDGKKFAAKENEYVPFAFISSPNEEIPAFEDLSNKNNKLFVKKLWCKKLHIWHRLTGPARILSDGREEFWLNGKHYKNIREWVSNHPNPDLYFNAIGIKTETDKILWFLQN
jgi:hypothetical protein